MASAEDALLAAALDGVAAIAANDVPRIAAYLSEDWVIVSDSGISARDQFLALVESGELAHTVRAVTGGDGVRVEAQGRNLRYAAMAALGLARLPLERQRTALGGATAHDLVRRAEEQARHDTDPGAVAITAWAAAEVRGHHPAPLNTGW